MFFKTESPNPDMRRWFRVRTADLAVSAPSDVFVKPGPFNTWRRVTGEPVWEATHVVSVRGRRAHAAFFGLG